MSLSRTTVVDALETVGISPKVRLPAGVVFALGVLLLVVGLILGNDTIWQAGLEAIALSGIGAGLGFAAAPGTVKVPAKAVAAPKATAKA